MRYLLALWLAAALSGCGTDRGPASYSSGSVGQVNRTVSGVVVSVRDVLVGGTNSLGAVTGTGIGAVAGSGLGGGTRGNLIGTIGGALAGGLVGSAIENSQTKLTGYEYVVETSNGNLMTLVQTGPSISTGTKVLVLYGSPSRIILDPRP